VIGGSEHLPFSKGGRRRGEGRGGGRKGKKEWRSHPCLAPTSIFKGKRKKGKRRKNQEAHPDFPARVPLLFLEGRKGRKRGSIVVTVHFLSLQFRGVLGEKRGRNRARLFEVTLSTLGRMRGGGKN